MYNSESNQWTAEEALEGAQEEFDVEQNVELLGASARNSATPVRPYFHQRMRMRRDAAQAYLRGHSISYYPYVDGLRMEEEGEHDDPRESINDEEQLHYIRNQRRASGLRNADYEVTHIQVSNEEYAEQVENDEELSEIRSPIVSPPFQPTKFE